MAVSKNTRQPVTDTNAALLSILRNSKTLRDVEPSWTKSLVHSETGEPALRFPVYGCLYQINVHSQALIDSLKAVSSKFGLDQYETTYHQALIQYVRSSATGNILGAMGEIEHTEAWLFQTQLRTEEKRLSDPDDAYFAVKEREADRMRQGLPPRIQFLDEPRVPPRPATERKTD